jgi:parvulin-like peptidyl-prolyl isomerase/thiol-disulfide isomerase/thioredoxin
MGVGRSRIRRTSSLRALLAVALAACAAAPLQAAGLQGPAAAGPSQVLVTVGPLEVTARDLDVAVASSPFAEKLPALEESDQAGLRGDLLRRLVWSRLLLLEARRIGIDQGEAWRRESEDWRRALLYRTYMERLRDRIVIPEAVQADMQAQFRGDAEGLRSARSAWISERYRILRDAAMLELQQRAHVQAHAERILQDPTADTTLLDADGIRIRYGDLVDVAAGKPAPNPEWVRERLVERRDLLLVSGVAQREGVLVDEELSQYATERLPALLVEGKEREWIRSEDELREGYKAHPELSAVPERRHLGELVVATQEQAAALRQRALAGESLFRLAGEFSIDPAGRAKSGDIGWHEEGRLPAAAERALADLPDGAVSQIVEDSSGLHLYTILERRPREVRGYEQVRERVRQVLINTQMRAYLDELARRYPVDWRVLRSPPGSANAPAQAAPSGAAVATVAQTAAQATRDGGLLDAPLPTLDGGSHRLSDWRGKVVVVHFWASWCAPCLREIPGLLRLQERFGERGLQVVGIGVDDEHKLENVRRSLGISYPVMIVALGREHSLLRAWGDASGAIPFVAVIDRDGRITIRRPGTMDEDEFREQVLPLLG